MPLSEKQLIANRANAQKSTGPRTEIGKRNSSRNSMKHGILARIILIEGESPERLDALATSLLSEYQPDTVSEELLVQTAVGAMWHLMRAWAVEAAGLNHEMKLQAVAMTDEDAATRAMLAFRSLCDNSRHVELLNRYQHRYERQYSRAIEALNRIRDQKIARAARSRQAEENKEPLPVVEPILPPDEPIQEAHEPACGADEPIQASEEEPANDR